jgi:hypothetical protein
MREFDNRRISRSKMTADDFWDPTPKTPTQNAYAERFVRSIKEECFSHLIVLGEGHLRHAINQYLEHYHQERNHQGRGSTLIDPPPDFGPAEGPVVLKTRLGGLLHHRVREAA